MWATPLLLTVPNIALCFTEQYSIAAKITNIVLPAAFYAIICGLSRNIGRTVLFMLPLMIFAAFQTVLLNLYGESIIAVDMFINVATTNVSEATELLGSLMLAIAIVCILYLPPLISGGILVYRKAKVEATAIRKFRRTSLALSAAGMAMLAFTGFTVPGYMATRELFPINVMSNLASAIVRTNATAHYHNTSENFSHHAFTTRPDSMPEVYVMVIGETSRAENWQLMGYGRPTNPRLSQRNDITAYPKALSESNTTHKSVPMLMSHLDATNFGDSIYYTKSIFEAFNACGYSTAFISNQRHNHSFIDFFGEQARHCEFITDSTGLPQHDMKTVECMIRHISRSKPKKIFMVLHTYGSHFNYRERYPEDMVHFTPTDNTEARAANRPQLLNAYDNSIRYTDLMLDSIINLLESLKVPAAMIYASDHGEDIFDDRRGRFLHASPTGTYHQLHVPLILWMSGEYRHMFPQKYASAEMYKACNISSSASLFHTMIDIAGISTPYLKPESALTGGKYEEPEAMFLNDYLEGVPLRSSGLRHQDFRQFELHGIEIGSK